LVETGTEG